MSATNRGSERDEHDFYPTPAWCVHRLLDHLELPTCGPWLEPMAGNGSIIRAVDEWHSQRFGVLARPSWDAVELQERFRESLVSSVGGDKSVRIGDFFRLGCTRRYQVIITNPAFSLAEETIRACLPFSEYVIMLLRVNFLGSQQRADWLRREAPDVYVLPNRPAFRLSKKTGKLGTDATEYAWFVWKPVRGRRVGHVGVLDLTPDSVIKEDKARVQGLG